MSIIKIVIICLKMCHNLKHLLITVNVQVVKLVEVLQRVNTVTESETVVSCLVSSSCNSGRTVLFLHEGRTEPDRSCFPLEFQPGGIDP